MNLRSSLDASFRKHPQRTYLLLSGVLLLCLYWHTLGAPFVYDDLDQIVNNPSLSSWHNFAHRFLLRPVTLATSLLAYAGSIYRPLFWLSLFVDRAVWGLNPAGFHATNLLLHFLNGFLAFTLLRRIGLSAKVAAGSALLWLSLPTNAEVVAWVSARSYELCTFFLFSCLLAALAHLRSRKLFWVAVCFVLAGCAQLSHELGIVAVPLLALVALGQPREAVAPRVAPFGAALLATALVAGVRSRVGAGTFSALASAKWAALAGEKYLAFIFSPVHLSIERSTSISLQHALLMAALPVIVLGSALFLAFWFRRTSTMPLGGLLWFLFGIAPFAFLMNYQGVAERFDYLASFGIVVAVLAAWAVLPATVVRAVTSAFILAWSAWSVVRTELRAADWVNAVQLYRSSLAATPNSPSLHFNLAFSLRQQGEIDEALSEYGRVFKLNPNYPHLFASMGDAYLAKNSYAAAQASYQRALLQNPADTAVLLNSGTAYQDAGDLTNAEATYLRLLEINPASSAAHVNLGVMYQGESRTKDAMHQFAMAIDLKAKDPTPYYDLGVILQQAGRADLAMVLYNKVLEFKPGDEDTLRNIQLMQQTR